MTSRDLIGLTTECDTSQDVVNGVNRVDELNLFTFSDHSSVVPVVLIVASLNPRKLSVQVTVCCDFKHNQPV